MAKQMQQLANAHTVLYFPELSGLVDIGRLHH